MVMIHRGVEVKTLESTKFREPSDSKQSTFPKRKEVRLRSWEELQGTLTRLEANDYEISAIFTCTRNIVMAITFSKDSKEATILEKALNNLLGQRITILRTDNPQQPIIVRPFTATTEAMKRVLKTDVTHTDSMHCRSNQTCL